MAYSNFTLEEARKIFNLKTEEAAGIFADIEPVPPSTLLTSVLERNVPLALAIGTEKARSELIVVDVLVELREHFERRISFFLGSTLTSMPKTGLLVCAISW